MTKTLTLKPRDKDDKGEARWHDYYIIRNALAAIARGKNFMKMAMWIAAAAKIETAAEESRIGLINTPEFSVELKNMEASLLWKELLGLPFECFGAPHPVTGQPQVPPVGVLQLMLADFAEQLGETLPIAEDE